MQSLVPYHHRTRGLLKHPTLNSSTTQMASSTQAQQQHHLPPCQKVGCSGHKAIQSQISLTPGDQQKTCPHLRVSWRLLCKSSAIIEVFEFVLLIDFVIAFASCTARDVLPHPIVPLLFLGGGKAGRWKEVKEQSSCQVVSDKKPPVVTRS